MMIVQDDYLVFPCPHCLELTTVLKKDINCRIFRHAVYKDNFEQVDPHLKIVRISNQKKFSIWMF
jgi:hypothetical protein